MSTGRIAAALLEEGIQIWADQGQIAYRAPGSVISAALRAQIGDRGGELAQYLGSGYRYAPASSAQQRLWFLHQFEDDKAVYNLPAAAIELSGPLHVRALQHGLDELVRRHDTLRTTFRNIDGVTAQRIAREGHWPIEIVAFDDRPMAEARTAAEALSAVIARTPFDLENGPLIRAHLIRLDSETHWLLLPVHHIVADGMSLGILIKELRALYSVFRHEQRPALNGTYLQYADYASWQRRRLQGPDIKAQIHFWKDRLAGVPPLLDLPTDHARPPVQGFDGARHRFVLPESITVALRAVSKREGATLYMGLLAVFYALLSRYARQEDVVVGVPAAGRGGLPLSEGIGLFVNTLALRLDFSGSPTVRETIRRVRRAVFEALAHQDAPFERVIEAAGVPRSFAHAPLFQAMFVHEPLPDGDSQMDGITLREIVVHSGKTKFDLTLFVRVPREGETGGVHATIEYSTALFERETIVQVSEHFCRLADMAVREPDVAIAKIRLVPDQEQRALIEMGQGPAHHHEEILFVHRLMEEQANRTPDAIAVVYEDECLSYRDLSARANGLAGLLVERGVQRGMFIPMLLDRGVDLAVGMLAVLKAGAAYAPIDPKTPPDRLRDIFGDLAPPIILTQRSYAKYVAGMAPPLFLEEHRDHVADAAPLVSSTPEDPAYVLFTSGSTGRPKGVVVEHRNLYNYVQCIISRLGLPLGSSFAFTSTFAADVVNTAVFPALATGGTLHIISEDRSTNGVALAEYMRRHAIDMLKIVPSHLAALLDAPNPADLLPKRCLVFGGEALNWILVDKVRGHAPGLRIQNHYGPTETTVAVMSHELDDAPRISATVPVGRPLPNSHVYVLDSNGNLTPRCMPGELYIGGAGVARGYLNRSELTDERFVPDPYCATPGMRMYRTGDRVRWLSSGVLEFLGRVDDQVKVRGFRVELGEIEQRLRACEMIQNAGVLVRGGELAAYVQLTTGCLAERAAEVVERALDTELRRSLPDYMIPSTYSFLDALPLTANGKLNRSALPAPAPRVTSPRSARPMSPTEEMIATIWRELLGIGHPGVHDNFLDVGGNSLVAIQLATRLSGALGSIVPLRLVFEAPTIAELASRLDTITTTVSSPENGSPLVVPIQIGSERDPLFCIAPAGGTSFPYYALAHFMGKDQSVFSLQDPAHVNGGTACETIEEMARLYVDAMRTIRPRGPYHLCGWSFGGVVAYEVARQLANAGEAVGVVALIEAHAPSRRRGLRVRDLGSNMRFLGKVGLSAIQASRDSFYLSAARLRDKTHFESSLATRLQRLWLGGLYHAYLENANLSQTIDQNHALLGLHHPNVRRFLGVARANLKAGRRYRPQPYSGKLTLFAAAEQPKSAYDQPDRFGWRSLVAPDSVSVHVIEGDHFTIMRNPNVSPLARLLRELLDKSGINDEH